MKIKGFTVTRKLDWSDLYSLCNKEEYYTCGTNEQYSNLYNMLYDEYGDMEDMTDERLIMIAEDIYDHSDIQRICDCYGADEAEVMQSILHNVYNACYTLMKAEVE